MKKLLLIAPALLLTLIMWGHDFWLQPEKFIYNQGETVNLRFYVGDAFSGINWSGDKSRVKGLRIFFENADDSCTRNLSNAKGDSLQLVVADEGTVMLTMQTGKRLIETPAIKFNAFLADNGMQDILDQRTANGWLEKDGKENYVRCAKTIIQVGNKKTNTFKKETGMVIDIIPKEHPYSIAKDGDFKVKILFHGKPLTNAVVKVWHKLNNKISSHQLVTDEEGETKFFISTIGQWMVSTVQMEADGSKDDKANWNSYQGSLTWGYTK